MVFDPDQLITDRRTEIARGSKSAYSYKEMLALRGHPARQHNRIGKPLIPRHELTPLCEQVWGPEQRKYAGHRREVKAIG